MKRLMQKLIDYGIKKIRANNYNCSPLDFYKPKKPVN